jgi:hypothetical protein
MYYSGLCSWIYFYANPYIDFSLAQFDWFLQALTVVAGLIFLGVTAK